MTPEQYEIMKRLCAGEAISVQLDSMTISQVWFHNQDPVDANVFRSLIDAGWVEGAMQDGAFVDCVVSVLGREVAHEHGKPEAHPKKPSGQPDTMTAFPLSD